MRKIIEASKETERERERERERGYKGETNGKVQAEIAADARIKNINVTETNRRLVLIAWKKLKRKNRSGGEG